MAGLSKADQAIEAKERREKEVPVGFLFFPKKNDPNWGDLWHPRGDMAPDQAIVQDIVDSGGVEKPIIVWQQVAFGGEVYIDGEVAKKGDPLLIVGDGSQRSLAAITAQPIMKKKGLLPDGKKDLFIPITKFIPMNPETAEREFLLLRQAHDADRLKKPHKPSVIAYNLAICKKKGATDEQLLSVCPPNSGWTKAVMDAALGWGNLSTDAAKAFDDGVEIKGKTRPVPITLLPVVILHSTKNEQVKTIIECISTGITSMKGWTRRQNAERSADTSDVDPEWDDEGEEQPATAGKVPPAKEDKPKVARSTTGRRPKRRVEKALELMPKEVGEDAQYFALGMSYEIGNEIELKGLSRELKAFLAGISWTTGNDEQKVPAIVRDAYDRAIEKDTPQGTAKGKGLAKGPKKRDRQTLEVS